MIRIEGLRQTALQHNHINNEFLYRFHKRYGDKELGMDYRKYADAFDFAFSELTPNISSGELVVGEIMNGLTASEREEWETVYKPLAIERTKLAGGGQDSHMAIEYELLLSQGLNGIIGRIEEYLKACDAEQAEFYSAAKSCLLAVIKHSENYSALAIKLAADEPDETRKNELLEIARICKKVPAQPAESFYEAVQSAHFVTYCLSLNPLRMGHQQFQLGHPDRYLLPYYEKDIKDGTLTKEKAQLLLDCLGIQINMRVPRGLSSGYMVGGRDENGEIVENELTEMLMQVIDDIRLVYPSVGLCYTEDMPKAYLAKACRILSHGRSHPAIFNDDIISKGLQSYGVPESESHSYIHSTCVEITPVASSNVWVASPYTNMAQLLLDTMTREYDSFDEHISALLEKLDASIQHNFSVQNSLRKHRAENAMNPLLSCFVKDCLARGADIEKGGARYNWIMPSFVGMANLVDSVYVLKKIVYEEKAYTVRSLKEILDNNFDGNERLRLRLLNGLPKYGNDIDEIDGYFGMFTDHIISECKKYNGIHTAGNLIPSVFCWVQHERFGRNTGATPDGRPAGFPLGDGSGPCQGRELNGPTASIISSTKWAHHELIGGVAVNMKFAKSSFGEHSVDVMETLIKAYMSRGGFELQINVTDKELLEKARKNPEEYRDLVVRIGGYSDYFTKLSPEMQQEVILRTEHRI
ncbi:MAG: hypothetical protein E7634_00890 [Ruminococcaceae bacterium]|nr:hypothetical protein [Oscillospiraceae bacterium]